MSLTPRILLVEDESSVLAVLRDTLNGAGFEVDTAQTAADALQLLADQRYAVVTADCFLPDLAPLDWLMAIRGTAPETPLILFSGAVRGDELRQFAEQWRARAVLEKPFAPAQLVAAVRATVEGARPADGEWRCARCQQPVDRSDALVGREGLIHRSCPR